jgi:hypothetical protein
VLTWLVLVPDFLFHFGFFAIPLWCALKLPGGVALTRWLKLDYPVN